MATILLVEDDSEIAEVVVSWLQMEKHTVDWVSSGEDSLLLFENKLYDLILLDWGLPKLNGCEVLRTYRASGGKAPAIFLTGRFDLDLASTGANDLLTKPFNMHDLSARIRLRLKRKENWQPSQFFLGPVLLDQETRQVFVDSRLVRLTNREFTVLELLMRQPDQVFSWQEVSNALKAEVGANSDFSEEAVQACIRNLRRKMSAEGQNSFIKTVEGLGYAI